MPLPARVRHCLAARQFRTGWPPDFVLNLRHGVTCCNATRQIGHKGGIVVPGFLDNDGSAHGVTMAEGPAPGKSWAFLLPQGEKEQGLPPHTLHHTPEMIERERRALHHGVGHMVILPQPGEMGDNSIAACLYPDQISR